MRGYRPHDSEKPQRGRLLKQAGCYITYSRVGMHFHVLGLGAIGHLVAHHLRRVLPFSHDVSIIHRSPVRVRDFRVHGGTVSIERDGITTPQKGFRSEPFDVPTDQQQTTPSADVEGLRQITSLIVTTKAHHVTTALNTLLPRISSDATIVLLQNGMGVYEELVDKVFRNEERRPHFILASNTHGAFIKSKYTAVHTGVGKLEFGIVPDPGGRDFEAGIHDESIPLHERVLRLTDIENPHNDPSGTRYRSLRETVSAFMRMRQLNTSWSPISETQRTMRRKLVVNAVINPMTAIMNCRNGDLLESTDALRILRRVCREAAKVFGAQHVAETQHWLDDLSQQGIDSNKVDVGRLSSSLSEDSLYDEVLRVAEVTRGNISSMLSDVRYGKQTEIQYITGYLLRLGRTYQVNMPYTAMLHMLLKTRCTIPIDQML
ncbi:hypothetical protein AX15_000648 [Amanita polypyramis BW_CC]|nr:hypothetical protein AX15_000648 [Amanita polypyramis BW_CC]